MDLPCRLKAWEAGGRAAARPASRLLPSGEHLHTVSWWATLLQLVGIMVSHRMGRRPWQLLFPRPEHASVPPVCLGPPPLLAMRTHAARRPLPPLPCARRRSPWALRPSWSARRWSWRSTL